MTDDDDREPDVFAAYLADLQHLGLMTADEERVAAERLWCLRRDAWVAILSFDTTLLPICRLLKDRGAPGEAVLEAPWAKRRAEARATASTLADFDCDLKVAREVAGQLDAARTGGGALELKKRPRGKSYDEYSARVTAAIAAVQAAEGEFAKGYLRLVIKIARHYEHAAPLPDLVQEGNLGLLKAIWRFDHRRGFRFSTYASYWIRHAVRRSINQRGRVVRIPVHAADLAARAKNIGRRFEVELGRQPDEQELAAGLGVGVKRLQEVLRLAQPALGLDEYVDGTERAVRFEELLVDPDAPEMGELVDNSHAREAVREALSVLEPIELAIVSMRHGLEDEEQELTLQQTGAQLRLSRERIRQLQVRAFQKLKVELRRRGVR